MTVKFNGGKNYVANDSSMDDIGEDDFVLESSFIKIPTYPTDQVRPWAHMDIEPMFERAYPEGEQQMKSVNCKRSDLLSKIKENRENHQEAFELAMRAYHIAVVKKLEAMLSVAKEGLVPQQRTGVTPPTNHTQDYDQEIEMLEMSIDDEITLSPSEFSRFVMDRWNWKEQFVSDISGYINAGEFPEKLHRALST